MLIEGKISQNKFNKDRQLYKTYPMGTCTISSVLQLVLTGVEGESLANVRSCPQVLSVELFHDLNEGERSLFTWYQSKASGADFTIFKSLGADMVIKII